MIASLLLWLGLFGQTWAASPPDANAGPDQTVVEGNRVTLDGSGSTDTNPGSIIQTTASDNLPGGTSIQSSFTELDDTGRLQGSVSIGEGPTVSDTAVVYVLDVSGSAGFAGGCGGNQNGDGRSDTVLDCEIAAALSLHEQVIQSGTVAEVGLIAFSTRATVYDLDPSNERKFLVDPQADVDNNGVNDFEQTIRGLRALGGTRFRPAVANACSLLAGSVASNRIAVFLSDGQAFDGPVNVLPCDPPVRFETFAVGSGADCDRGSNGSQLGQIGSATGGTCTNVTEVDDLPELLPAIIGSRITRATLSIDGGPEMDISNQLTPALPISGPGSAQFSYLLPADLDGATEVCVTLTAEDAGGAGSLRNCTTVSSGDAPLSYQWRLLESSGPPIFLSSSAAEAPSFLVSDDGQYVFELRVTNNFGLNATDRITVDVSNSIPTLDVEYSEGVAQGVTLISASFTDNGIIDSHSGSIDWGDGAITDIPVTVSGPGWGSFFGSHIYENAGTYPISVVLQDDDGGVVSEQVDTFTVAPAVAVWANSSSSPDTFRWTGNRGRIEGRVHSNFEATVNGSTKTFDGPLTYVDALTGNIKKHDFLEVPVLTSVEDFPVVFDINDYRPGGRVSGLIGEQYFDMSEFCVDGTWHETQSILEPGVYYAGCNIKLNGSNIGGAVTLAAEGQIQIAGARPAFEPFHDGLLMLSGSGDEEAIKIATSSSKFLGVIFSANGQININGGSNRFYCGILGDRVNITGSDTDIRGADCATSTLSTMADPLLVPDLQLSLVADKPSVLPGQAIDYSLELANDGAQLIVPALIGLENVDLQPASVQAFSYAIEYFDIATGQWSTLASLATALPDYSPSIALPSTGGLVLTTQANERDGVAFGTAPYSILDTAIEPGGFATWGTQAVINLDSDTVELMLDTSRALAIRSSIQFDLSPADVQVRRLYTFGNDFIDELRSLAGNAINADVTLIQPSGDAVSYAGSAALVNLQQGDAVVLNSTYANTTLDAKGGGEDRERYLARLAAADGASLYAGAYAQATGGVGLLFAPAEQAVVTQVVPIVSLDVTAAEIAYPGDTLTYAYAANNTGSATADNLSLSTRVDGESFEIVPPLPATIDAGDVVNSALSVALDADRSAGTLFNRNRYSWSDTLGIAYGPIDLNLATAVIDTPGVAVALHDSLAVDADANGLVSPGDVIGYEAIISNRGGEALTGLVLSIPLDDNVTLVADAIDADGGDVSIESSTLRIGFSSIEANTDLSITFDLAIDNPLQANVSRIQIQGNLSTDQLDAVLTDDPAIDGLDNPTFTSIVRPEPAIYATLVYELARDVAGDGFPGAGDTLRFSAVVANLGTAVATDVIASFNIPDGATLKSSATMAPAGAVISTLAGRIDIELPQLLPLQEADITFELTADQPLPIGVEAFIVQGTVEASEVSSTLTDNPNTIQELDPTVVMLSLYGEDPQSPDGGAGGSTPSTGDDSYTGGNGLPAPTLSALSVADGVVVASVFDITATLSSPEGESLLGWTVYYRPLGSTELTELASGTTSAVAATLDPSLLANGVYGIVIESRSSNGGISRLETIVTVQSEFKPGRFSVSYDDVSGIFYSMPITVKRSYDTLDTGKSGDFGRGWSLSTADIQVQTNGLLGAGGWRQEVEQQTILGPIYKFVTDKDHFVAVTWPNGNVDLFDLVPNNTISWFAFQSSAQFVARSGSTSTLRVADGSGSLYFTNDGNLYNFSQRQLYNPQRFVITDPAGNEYLVDKRLGIQQIKNASGSIVTIDSNGIRNSDGQSIVYQRDAEQRITQITDLSGNSIRYDYDESGNLIRVTDQVGDTTEFGYLTNPAHYLSDITDSLGRMAQRTEYDENGRAIASIDALGNRIAFDFDPDALTYSTTDRRGYRTQYQYDQAGNQTRMIDAEGGVSVYRYDDPQNPYMVTQEVDPNGNTIEYAYDASGNLTKTTWENGSATTFVYDAKSRLATSVHLNNSERKFSYNDVGKPSVFTNERQFSTGFTHDSFGRIASVTDPEGHVTSLSYDDAQRAVTIVNPDGTERTHYRNRDGYVTRVVDENGDSGQAIYDEKNRLTGLVDRKGKQTDIVYNGDNITRITYPDGTAYSFQYDDNDRLITETDPLGVTSFYDHDANGNVISVADADGNTTRYTYDGNNRLTLETGPEGIARSYDYDAAGNVVKATDRNGRSIVYVYDSLNRIAAEKWYAATGDFVSEINLGYDLADRIVSMRGPDTHLTFAYNEANFITQVVDNNAPGGSYTLNYRYDSRDYLIEIVDSAGVSVASTVDPVGQYDFLAWNLASGSSLDVSFSRDSSGKITQLQRSIGGTPGTSTSDYAYDANGMLASVIHRNGSGTVVEDIGYTYGDNRKVTRETGSGEQIDYLYDSNYQYLDVDDSRFSQLQTFDYDSMGNHRADQEQIGVANRLLEDDDFDYLYDNEGNLVERTDTLNNTVRSYAYDHRNRLVSATEEASDGTRLFVEQYRYDALGRRVGVSTDVDGDGPEPVASVYHVYDGDNVWADFDAAGVDTWYLFGEGVDRILASYDVADGFAFYLADKQGSVRSVLGADFDLVARVDYDAFGNPVNETGEVAGSRYKFQGREYDEATGLYYFRARYYDPVAKRFISEDPLAFDSGDFNFYRFVNNSPANWIDPFGQNAATSYAILAKQIITEAGLMALDCIGLQTNSGLAQMTFYVLWASNPRKGLTGFYVGRTNNLAVRLSAHKRGKTGVQALHEVTFAVPPGLSKKGTRDWVRWVEQKYMDAFKGYKTSNARVEIKDRDKFDALDKKWCG